MSDPKDIDLMSDEALALLAKDIRAEQQRRREAPGSDFFCDVCPHARWLHNPDGTCGCGTDCPARRAARNTEGEDKP